MVTPFQDGQSVWVHIENEDLPRAAIMRTAPDYALVAYNGERYVPYQTSPVALAGIELAGTEAPYPYKISVLEWADTGEVDFILVEGWQGIESQMLFDRRGTDVLGEGVYDFTAPVGEWVFLTRDQAVDNFLRSIV